MRSVIFATVIVASLGLAAAPAQAVEVFDVGAQGACKAGGQGASDEAGARLETDGIPPHAVEYPETADAREAATACASGGGPGPGSHLAADASAVDGAAEADASTVPATDYATGQDGDLRTAAAASGACYAGGEGAADEAGAHLEADGIPPHGVEYPDAGAARDALAACAAGGGPGPGSYLAAGVIVADGTASAGVSTVPVTDALP